MAAIPEKLRQIQIQINALPPGEVLRFPGPNQDMLLATGILAQTYNYIELNLRRCVETFAHAKLLNGSRWGRQPTLIPKCRGGSFTAM